MFFLTHLLLTFIESVGYKTSVKIWQVLNGKHMELSKKNQKVFRKKLSCQATLLKTGSVQGSYVADFFPSIFLYHLHLFK